ncbi:hypothetical protein I656_02832 [Geobacillus sp. WSUCF1]|nr:hypothetical protein I656_02832 [Geobacillus sp. WSUCF1]
MAIAMYSSYSSINVSFSASMPSTYLDSGMLLTSNHSAIRFKFHFLLATSFVAKYISYPQRKHIHLKLQKRCRSNICCPLVPIHKILIVVKVCIYTAAFFNKPGLYPRLSMRFGSCSPDKPPNVFKAISWNIRICFGSKGSMLNFYSTSLNL